MLRALQASLQRPDISHVLAELKECLERNYERVLSTEKTSWEMDPDMLPVARVALRFKSMDVTALSIMTFGDSVVDVGNNDYLPTIFKANYPLYGRDFADQKPTGRFCNGKLATDITGQIELISLELAAETLGFTSYPPAYLSPEASEEPSHWSQFCFSRHAITLTQQVEYFKEYQGKLAKVAGSSKSASIIKDALYVLSAGSGDFLQNYYVNPLLNHAYTPDQYGSFLIEAFTTFVKNTYGLGVGKIGVTSLRPLGCIPLARTLFGNRENGCVTDSIPTLSNSTKSSIQPQPISRSSTLISNCGFRHFQGTI
ncbi:GDSL esterase/lipase [Hibiscus syriacus]|uniref:GDSL esterase/lipase n=1 Tax=Hibiscus syriacus TaxID=106335 RepID=A0A6A2YN22_HIBSY|nr:GDSL esterase/lipase [Hibiscus syriacus]